MRYTKYAIVPVCLSLIVAASAAAPKAAKRAAPKLPPTAGSPAVELRGNETAEQIQHAYAKAIAELLPALASNESESFRKFEILVQRAGRSGAEKERAACCQALAAVLLSDAPQNARVWILKQLFVLGRAEVVPAEAKLLGDNEPLVRETARRALEHNPAAEAAAVLREALTNAKAPSWQAALVLSLGARQDSASVGIIGNLLGAKDPQVVEAALVALGKIGNAEAARILADAQGSVPEDLRVKAAESHFKCAERMLAAGQNEAATAIYRQHNQPQAARSIRLAALTGLLRASGDQAGHTTLRILAGNDADARAVATGMIAELNAQAIKELASGFGRLPADRQRTVLAALAARGEKAALPTAVAAAKSKDAELRLAGLIAVGQVGDESAVPMLVQVMQGEGDAVGVARESLLRLASRDVNGRLISIAEEEKNADRRAALIDVLEARGAPEVVALVLRDVSREDAKVRRQAMRVLGKLGPPAHIAVMLAGLYKAQPGGEREDAEKAIAAVAARIVEPEKQAAPIIEAYRRADSADQPVLLPLLGRIGGPLALDTIKASLASGDAEGRDAAIRGLCNWPDAGVAKDLLQLARQAEKDTQRVMALRALVRVATLKQGIPDKEKLSLLTQAMDLAQRDQERTLILDRAGNIRNLQMFRFVVPSLDNPALATAASRAVVDLSHNGGLRSREKAEYEAALSKVVQVCKDKGVVERASRELRGEP